MQAVDSALGVDSPWFLRAVIQSAGRVLSLIQLSHWRIALVHISLLDLHHIQVDSERWIALMGSSILLKQLHSVYIRAWREREASSHRGLLVSQQSILLGTLSFQDGRATDPGVKLILSEFIFELWMHLSLILFQPLLIQGIG